MTVINFDVILIDTSIYRHHGFRFKKGLLNKLNQFKNSPNQILLPDVIMFEVIKHYKIEVEKTINKFNSVLPDAFEYLDIENINIFKVKNIDMMVKNKVNTFINDIDAKIIKCSDFTSLSEIVVNYFSNSPPFKQTGKKKNEFPDAIILYAVEKWAKQNKKKVIAVSIDEDWENYCKISKNISFNKDLSTVINNIHSSNSKELVSKLIDFFNSSKSKKLKNVIYGFTEDYIEDITPFIQINSKYHCEEVSSYFNFQNIELQGLKEPIDIQIIDIQKYEIGIQIPVQISIMVEAEFELYVYDSVDKDYLYMGSKYINELYSHETDMLLTLIWDERSLETLALEEIDLLDEIEDLNFASDVFN